MTTTDLSQLGWDLASDGFVGREAAVRLVVRSARSAGISSVATGVLADSQEPEVARMRAFGLVAAALAVHDVRPSVVAAHAA